MFWKLQIVLEYVPYSNSFISYFQKKESEAVKHIRLNKWIKAVRSKSVICKHLAAQTWYNISMGAV